MNKRWLSTLGWIAFLTPIYVGAGKAGLSLAFLNESASAVWPPTGLALAAMLLLGVRVWPAILIGAFVVNWGKEHQFDSSAAIAIGNTAEALLAAVLVRKYARGIAAFDSVPDIVRFVLYAAIPSTALSATIGVTYLATKGLVPWDGYAPVWITWWTGDVVSDLVVAPLIIIWSIRGLAGITNVVAAEALLLLILLVGVSAAIYAPQPIFNGNARLLARLSLPILLWAAFRFHQRGATMATFVISSMAIYGTRQGFGPLVSGNQQAMNLNETLIQLQTFMGSVALTLLVVAAVVAERQRVLAILEKNQLRLTEALAEQKQSLAREQEARREAERASRAKDEFLAVLSHELRTPLTPVMLTASLLESDPDLPAPLRQDLGSIRRNVEMEARLIDDLLDLTRVSRGKLLLDLQPTDVHEVIRRAVEICCNGSVASTSVELAAAQHHILGDPARIQQVFWNLLNNACKFTPKTGHVIVRSFNRVAAGTSEANAAGAIVVEVCDNGVGIARELMPRLFTPFEQGDSVNARRAGGLGLGLAISKALVVAHGGELTAHSDGPGCGAVLRVQFPTNPIIPNPLQPESPRPTGRAGLRPLRILLVEDHAPTLIAIHKLLNGQNHKVVTATSVAAALEAADGQTFDLLISDLGLPDGLGHQIMRTLGPKYALKGIALSGYGMPADLEASREAGFAEHLIKPVDIETLESAIMRVTANPPT